MDLTTLIPRPPPPIAALMIIGNPWSSTNSFADAKVETGPSLPGTTGTPAFKALPFLFHF